MGVPSHISERCFPLRQRKDVTEFQLCFKDVIERMGDAPGGGGWDFLTESQCRSKQQYSVA